MTTSSKLLVFTSASLKTGIGSLIALGLVGCDSLSRLTMRSTTTPPEATVVEAPPVAAVPLPTTDAPPEIDNIAAELEKESKNTKLSSPLYEWKGDGRKITRIVVNTTEQKARFYAGDEQVGWSTVATGLPKYPTPTGRFQVTEKVENKRSNLYGKVYGKGGRVLHSSAKRGRDAIPAGARFEGARMPFFMRLTEDGVGLHAGPIPNPGQPASHGCIRMPSKLAPVLFKHVANGTAVTIEGKGPNYGDYVARQRANATRRAEAQRVAAQRPAAPKAQPAAKPQPKPQAAPVVAAKPKPKQPEIAAAESHAVAKDQAVVATPTLDPANTRETRLLEPNTPTPAADTARVQPFVPPAAAPIPVPTPALTPTPGIVKPEPAATAVLPPAPVTPPPAAPSVPEPPAPRTESIPLTLPPPKPTPVAPLPTPARPAVEIVEAPTSPAPAPVAPPAPAPAPAPKPAEPTPAPAPAPAPKPAEPAPAATPAPAPAQ